MQMNKDVNRVCMLGDARSTAATAKSGRTVISGASRTHFVEDAKPVHDFQTLHGKL